MMLNLDTHERFSAVVEALDQFVQNGLDAVENEEVGEEHLPILQAAEEMLNALNAKRAELAG